MLPFLLRRAGLSLVSIIGLIALVFFLTRLTGDPTALFLPPDATPEARAEFARLQGLDAPIPIQFLTYLRDLLVLDFGDSLRQNRPAMDIALEAFPRTLQLAAVALTLSVTIAVTFGCLAANRPGGPTDRLVSVVSLAGASAPDFWIAIVGILIFAVSFGMLPTSGTGSAAHYVLPVFVLMLRPTGLLVQVVRGSMISALNAEYIKTARAKGVPRRRILVHHALRNSALPVITVAGDLAASLVNGAVVVETIFGWPGIGKLMIDAISQRDFAVVQATIIVTALAIFVLNIVVDVLYVRLDPRISHA